ncbi:MAG: hypothetical protein DHS20C18_19180 [Saprospiraceae bacterium]|nr:MAG: hypothetical protein DHS20C18_19180 [Saprospiraceae bacterium]
MLNRDAIWMGLILGLLIPFVGYALVLTIFEQLEALGLMSKIGMTPYFRERTSSILAISLNLLPLNFYQRRKYNETTRGLVVMTGVYVIAWLIYFGRYVL